ncbi:MAG TPA: bifunctional riboflavin kinase/FAD synthetase [Burkholderiales bacterium]|nr:bifunctional riboflavin kinase/FAD synthetase [Burkholderiales bacterium]
MQVTHGSFTPGGARLALTIGNFDGVHRGHQAMLGRTVACARAQRLASCALTFEPHPREFFSPATAPARLTRLRDKLEQMAAAGLDRVHVARFDARLASLPAERFVEDVLVRGLGAAWLLVGRDFRFGAKRGGDFELLERLCARHGVALEAMPDVTLEGERISSSAVRSALAAGDLAAAALLLGHPYAMSGRVVHGEKLGRELGFPTANLVLRRRPAVAGIFVVEALAEGESRGWPGVASVGRRPTVNPSASPLLEVHLLDFAGDLYRRHLQVRFLKKLRDERKYDDVPQLRAAIAQDAEAARRYFSSKTNA